MRWKTQTLVAGILTLAWAAPAHACNFWFNSTFFNIPGNGPVVGAGFMYWGGDYSSWTAMADVAFKAGDKFVIRPAVGTCSWTWYDGSNEMTENDLVYGASVGVNAWNDATGKIALNVQAGVEIDPYDGGTERNIPVGVAVNVKTSETLALYGGAAVNFYNDDYDSGSYSSNDPSIFGGVAFMTGKVNITAGVSVYMGEDETDTGFNVGASMGLGSGMNALRKIGSMLRLR